MKKIAAVVLVCAFVTFNASATSATSTTSKAPSVADIAATAKIAEQPVVDLWQVLADARKPRKEAELAAWVWCFYYNEQGELEGWSIVASEEDCYAMGGQPA